MKIKISETDGIRRFSQKRQIDGVKNKE